MSYCISRFFSKRLPTYEVNVGNLALGGANPIRIQSMTNTSTLDIDATVRQVLQLAEAGCEIVRITAQNVEAAKALGPIHAKVRAAKCEVPLVADIHFLPQAAMEAVNHVEKVRVNPGNYADKKKFASREYSDSEYTEELERIHNAFSPLVLRAKALGRALRIGTNHGSLSDRIMNRYGDTPLGMVESALEFIRICESHGFYDIVLSMKASNPKVMIEAYRLVAQKMSETGRVYPLHLGVTEAGDGEDGRIKSAIGIGSLLLDGLGDTIRVSLTEDPVYEIPVAREIAKRAEHLWIQKDPPSTPFKDDSIDPYSYNRRNTESITLSKDIQVGSEHLPRVIVPAPAEILDIPAFIQSVTQLHAKNKEQRIEGLLFQATSPNDLSKISQIAQILAPSIPSYWVESPLTLEELQAHPWNPACHWVFVHRLDADTMHNLPGWISWAKTHNHTLAVAITHDDVEQLAIKLKQTPHAPILISLAHPNAGLHPTGSYRALAEALKQHNIQAPLWIRMRNCEAICSKDTYLSSKLIEASILAGSLLCDGLGDALSIEHTDRLDACVALSYNILQGSRMRSSKTEFVACPSCGRTLFNLEDTTKKIRAATGHLKGVTIAVMGCIVNGPGEMADADFGYVGGAPGKINLYVRKDCVQYNIPEEQAVESLIALIKSHGKWIEPEEPDIP